MGAKQPYFVIWFVETFGVNSDHCSIGVDALQANNSTMGDFGIACYSTKSDWFW